MSDQEAARYLSRIRLPLTALRHKRLTRGEATVAGILVIGVALRAWILLVPRLGKLDADESVSGLMARHFADGEFTAFFWGQSYGGTAEVALTAVLFKLLGPSTLLPKVVTIGLHGLGAWLTWRVGLRLFEKKTAAIAGALAWAWPTYAVWKSNRLMGFYALGLVLVMAVALLVIRIEERPRPSELLLLGFITGLGWWTHPTVLFVAVPAAIWLIFRRPRLLIFLPVVVIGAILGSLPWLWSNLANDWHSLDNPLVATSLAQYWDALRGLFIQPLPAALGLRVPGSAKWVFGPVIGVTVYVMLLAGLCWLSWRHRYRKLGLLSVVMFGYLTILAVSTHALYRDEPRYLYIVMPILGLLVAQLGTEARMHLSLPALLVVFSVAGLFVMSQFPKDPWVPADFKPLIEVLENEGVDRAFAFHTIAYRLSFESEESIIATPIDHPVRYQPYDQAVRNSSQAAYVFAPMPAVANQFAEELDDRGLVYDWLRAGDFTVVIPQSAVSPDVFDSLRPSQ